jgi:uncharacterized protein
MNMTTATAVPRRFNPVFWIMWVLPASAVLASFATLGVALEDADRALPADYHWEGERLDEDFARARQAAALGIELSLEIRAGQCRVVPRHLSTPPATLDLLLTHGSVADFDRRVRLARGADGDYLAVCAPLAPGKWRVALDDESAGWAIRGVIDASPGSVMLRARDPDGAKQ